MTIKKRMLRISLLMILVSLLGVSYAFFKYFKVGINDQMITGEIYLKYNDGVDTLSLSNVFPETNEEARARDDNVLKFTISGKNTTTNKDIYYEIRLLHGDNKSDKMRFSDSDIKFDLIETINGESKIVLDAVSYDDFTDTRIYTNLVDANTNDEIIRTYELRMWLSGDVIISDTSENANYTTSAFNNSYSNVKVAVFGDFTYKEYFYTINYETNGGTLGSDVVTSYSMKTETFDLPLPSLKGHGFKGWYTNPELTGDVYTRVEKGTKGDKTYYAKWEPYKTYNNVNIYDVVKDDAITDDATSLFVSNEKGVSFEYSAGISNGYGVYTLSSTKNDSFPVYYYRGPVGNNNVLFGNYCWKIVRTTETGGTKLFFNGVPTNGTCNNTGTNSQLANKIKFNSLGTLEAVGYSYGKTHKITYKSLSSIANGIVFGNDVTYVDGHYEFINNDENDIYIVDNNIITDAESILKTHHYTCFETADKQCSTMYFIYMIRGTTLYYVTLHTGEKIEDAIYNSLTNSTNTTSSTIKTYIDNWYATNMTNYTSYLEDTIWCNDRSIASADGWTKDGEILDVEKYKINFSGYKRISTNKAPSLKCTNPSDRFTVSTDNGNGALTYPTALLTMDETALAGYVWFQDSDNNYLNNDKVWWTMTPTLLSVGNVYLGVVYSIMDNVHAAYTSNGAGGVRPSISLKYGVKVLDGNGADYNPFVIKEIE